jgi:hypothetical protein
LAWINERPRTDRETTRSLRACLFSHSSGYTLVNPRLDFTLAKGESFPIWYPELWLFAQLTGSYGRHRFRIRMMDVTDPSIEPVIVFETPERTIDLGQSGGSYRRLTRSWAVKLNNVPFPRPGRYELWLTFEGIPHGRLELVVEGKT